MAMGMGCTYGKCDHFTLGEAEGQGKERNCYVTTEFYRCSTLYPARSYIATRGEWGEQIILTLPEISARSQEWACLRSCLTQLSILGIIFAGLGTFLLQTLYGTSYWWSFPLMWIAVVLFLIAACYAGRYKHYASEEDKAKYIQIMGEAAVLRNVLEQLRNARTQPAGQAGPNNPPPYSETSPLNYGYDQGPIQSYGGLGVPGNMHAPPAYHPGTTQPGSDHHPARDPHNSTPDVTVHSGSSVHPSHEENGGNKV